MQSTSPPGEINSPDPAEDGLSEESRLVRAGPRTTTGPDDQKRSFWRRISLRRRKEEASEQKAAPSWTPGESIGARLAILERRIDVEAEAIRGQLERIDGRFDEVWEMEEQISHLIEIQQKLDALAEGQQELATRTTRSSRRNGFLVAVAIGTAALAAFLSAGL